MGRTWKFTEQIYEELGEAIDKKIETRFDTGVIAGGPMGMFGNPFEKYADEINMGISKMNSYVDMINEADGFNRTKLDRVFNEVAEIDRNYGNQISKCIDNLEHYKNVLYQLEVVMEQALVNSTNGNAVFDFDREKFQEKVADDKHAMDIAYVDRILEKDASEITYEEYYSIAVMLGNQPTGDTELLEHILNRTDMWTFVNTSVWKGEISASELIPGQPSNGVFIPTDKYQALSAVLSFYALKVTMEKPENAEGTSYITFMDRVVMYEQIFRGIVANTMYNEWDYLTGNGQEREMVDTYVGNMFRVEYRNGELVAIILGRDGRNEIVSHVLLEDSAATDALVDMQNTYINNFLGLDKTGIEITADSILEGLYSEFKGKVVTTNPYVNLVLNAIGAGIEQENKRSTIYEYEKWGEFSSTFQLLELGLSSCECEYGGSMPSNLISAYPSNRTLEVLKKLNDFLAGEEVKKEKYQRVMERMPEGGFTLNYVLNHLEETDSFLHDLKDVVISSEFDGEKYANSVEEAIGKE